MLLDKERISKMSDNKHYLVKGDDCPFCGTGIYYCNAEHYCDDKCLGHHIYSEYPSLDHPNSEEHIEGIEYNCLMPTGHCQCSAFNPETLLDDDNSIIHPTHPKLNYRITK